jgi:hypothetical protein
MGQGFRFQGLELGVEDLRLGLVEVFSRQRASA